MRAQLFASVLFVIMRPAWRPFQSPAKNYSIRAELHQSWTTLRRTEMPPDVRNN